MCIIIISGSLPSTNIFLIHLPTSYRSVCLSTEDDQLKFNQTTLALRKIYRETSISNKSTNLQCPSCDLQTSGNMKIHQKHHVKKWNQHQSHLCSYSVGTKPQLTSHLQNHHHSQNEEVCNHHFAILYFDGNKPATLLSNNIGCSRTL